MITTVCQFCNVEIACSPRPENLVPVEKHHSCPKMREFLLSSGESIFSKKA
jgi:hypothetical protein